LLAKINGNQYKESSKIKLSIVGYLKEPTPNFKMGGLDSTPKTIKLPDAFVPPMQKDDSSQ
jgi:hypothetical protein